MTIINLELWLKHVFTRKQKYKFCFRFRWRHYVVWYHKWDAPHGVRRWFAVPMHIFHPSQTAPQDEQFFTAKLHQMRKHVTNHSLEDYQETIKKKVKHWLQYRFLNPFVRLI